MSNANNCFGPSGAKTTKGGRDGEKQAAPPADDDRFSSSSDDGEGGGAAGTAGTGLPMANLVRLVRQVVPKGIKVSTRAKHLTHDCAVEFVGFVADEAGEQAKAQHRRTIAPEDFICAFQTLGFDDYVQPMSTYTRRYHEHHNNSNAARGYRGSSFAQVPRRPPPPDVADESADEGSSSTYTPTPAGRGYGYRG